MNICYWYLFRDQYADADAENINREEIGLRDSVNEWSFLESPELFHACGYCSNLESYSEVRFGNSRLVRP